MGEFTEYVDRQSRFVLVILGYVLLILLGLLDHLTEELRFEPFYLAPVFMVTWFGTRRAGILVAVTSVCVWGVANGTLLESEHAARLLWDLAVELGMLLVFAWLVGSVRQCRCYMKALARQDALTGLINRDYFVEIATAEIKRAKRYAHPFTLACIDFSAVASDGPLDVSGVGDSLMAAIAKVVRSVLRETDLAARLDGSLVILFPEADKESARSVVQKLQEELVELMSKQQCQVNFGIGAVTYLEPPKSVAEMVTTTEKLAQGASRRGHAAVKYDVVPSNR